MRENKCALTEIVDDQCRKDEAEPGEANGNTAEVAHVGVDGLSASDGQEDAAKRDESDSRIAGHETETLERIDCRKDFRALGDLDKASDSDDGEVKRHHRSRKHTDHSGAARLD